MNATRLYAAHGELSSVHHTECTGERATAAVMVWGAAKAAEDSASHIQAYSQL
jgi:hypothetical protein